MIDMSLQQSEPVALPPRPHGRQARSVAVYSLATALMIITALPVFVPAAIFHCAIRNGRRAAYAMAVLALAIAGAYVNAVPQSAQATTIGWLDLAAVALAMMVPALLALPLVERAEKLGQVLVILLLASAVGLAVMELGSRALFSFSPWATLITQVQATHASAIQKVRSEGAPLDAIRFAEQWLSYNRYLMPGALLASNGIAFLLSLLMLGRLEVWRERTEAQGAYLFRNFSLPDGLLFAFILGGLSPLASGMLQKAAANMLFVVAFLYFLQGLAVVRFLMVAMGAGWGGALMLAFLALLASPILALAGLFDPFFDFRHFKKRKDDSHESHSD